MSIEHVPGNQRENDNPALAPMLLSVKQAAKSLGVSLSHFYVEVLPHLETVKIGARNLVCREDLERFIAARKKARTA